VSSVEPVVPNAAYRHFADWQALLAAVRSAAQSALAVAIEAELAKLPHQDDPADAGVLPRKRRRGAELLAWSAVHGLAMLLMEGPLRSLDRSRSHTLGQRLLDMVERGL
jgi:hypothetical protein